METRSNKRKQSTSPTNPYAKTYAPRRRNRLNNDRTSVIDLRARRVFSPASISDVKGSIDGADANGKVVNIDVEVGGETEINDKEDQETGGNTEIDDKEVHFDLGVSQKDQIEIGVSCESQSVQHTPADVEILGKSSQSTEVDDKEVAFDLGVSQNDQIEIGVSSEDQSVQPTPADGEILVKSNQNIEIDQEKTLKDERVKQSGSFVGEGEREGQGKSKVKSGVLAPCSRTKLYKNPSSFSYRRLLPFLMDLAKDNSNVPGINSSQKVDKSVEERYPASLSASPVILIDGTGKEVLTNRHPFGGSNTFTGPSNVENSSTRSPEYRFTESTTFITPKISIPSTINASVIKELPHLYGETASQAPKDMPNVPSNSSISLVISDSSSLKEGGEHDEESHKNNGNTETESYDGEWIQSTPPDSDIFCKPGPVTSKDSALESPLNNISIHDKSSCVGEGERHTNSKAKLGVLVPCSRMKLYKTPGSFSYRRLLPYLMDLAKNDTDTLGNHLCQNVEKTVDEGPPSFLGFQKILENGPNKEVLTNGGSDASPNLESTKLNSPTGSSNVHCSNLESYEDPPVEFVIEDPLVESTIQVPPETSIVSEVDGSMIMEPLHIDVENASQVRDAARIVRETNLVINSSSSHVIPETRGPSLLREGAIDDCSIIVQKSSTDVNSPGELCLNQDSYNIEPHASSENSGFGPPTGILKRHRRGCRGICTCLNCALFRLQAERAFEFSRNQMDDTEEVAMELMKELSDIRTLLEKSIDGAECHAVVQVQQVKEACAKALSAEELAKRKLKQMNKELNIHCRTPCLQRPRVKFADNSEM